MSKAELKKTMQAQGYSAVVVGADDGHLEGEAVKDGRIVEFHADAKTGRITESEPKEDRGIPHGGSADPARARAVVLRARGVVHRSIAM